MFPGLSWGELVLVGVIAILLFGKRLPEVAKSLGNSYRQFRQGLSEFHAHVDLSEMTRPTPSHRSNSSTSSSVASSADDYDEPTAPRFEPPPSEPTPPSGSVS
jgi:sec-independent protein translocase protein TatA